MFLAQQLPFNYSLRDRTASIWHLYHLQYVTPDLESSLFEKESQALPRKALRIGHGNSRHYSHPHFIFKICFCFSSTLKLQLSPFILQNHLQISNWRLSVQWGKVYPDLMFVYHKCSCSPPLSTLVALRILLCLMPED